MLTKMIKADVIIMPNVQDMLVFFLPDRFPAAHESYKMSQITVFLVEYNGLCQCLNHS